MSLRAIGTLSIVLNGFGYLEKFKCSGTCIPNLIMPAIALEGFNPSNGTNSGLRSVCHFDFLLTFD